MVEDKAYQATPDLILERQIMDSNVPKNEREWWARNEIERLREALNGAYTERNRVVALLASVFPSGLKRTSIPDWDEEWNGCVYIDLPTGQASWHFHDREAHLFSHLPPYEKDWDGHTTEEKYDRLARSALQQKDSE